MKDGRPYLIACGKCNVPFKVHPVKNCPYLYKPIKHRSRVIGYKMTTKKG